MSLAISYFEDLYARDDDPWRLGERWYERRKREIIVASLPRQRYRSAFEPACANGQLTSQLAPRCERLLAVDAVAGPVARAQRRLGALPGVVVEQRRLPAEWPGESFDLIVVSEFLYYFDAEGLAGVLRRAVASLEPHGCLVAVHWRHPVAEHPLSGDAVHRAIRSQPELAPLARHEEEDFLLDVLLRRAPAGRPPSVARATAVPGAGSGG